MQFPAYRLRRLRINDPFRRLVRETNLTADHLVAPLFVLSGRDVRNPIPSLPGHAQLSVDQLRKEAKALQAEGIPAVLLFGIAETKDDQGTGAFARDGIVQRAVKELKDKVPDLLVFTDVCLCGYTSHGHCGILDRKGEVDNDATLEVLAETALSHARAGADLVAPSAMMDGQVQAIREALDEGGFEAVPLMAYAAKYASAFFGPFREAAQCVPRFGDRLSYQMDPANSDEALREMTLDVEEGADILMVKPALPYLDIIRRAKEEFDMPVAAFNVSGEFAMVKAAARLGWLDENRAMQEVLTAIRRAGADILITYFAREAAALLRKA